MEKAKQPKKRGRKAVPKAYRYCSLVPPLREVLPPDGLLMIVRWQSETPNGDVSFGFVDYDHPLPAKVQRAYLLEYLGTTPMLNVYPQIPFARNPDEVREVLAILHPELVWKKPLAIPKPPVEEPNPPKEPEPVKEPEPEKPYVPDNRWKPDGPMWLIPGKVLYEPPNNIRRKSEQEDEA